MGIIQVKGIRCYAYHGCLPEETVIGSEYTVDVWIKCNLEKAIASDNLKHTVDYCSIHSIVLREMKQPSKLVEQACGRILTALKKELPAIEKARVRVTKFNPPMNGDVREASVMLIG